MKAWFTTGLLALVVSASSQAQIDLNPGLLAPSSLSTAPVPAREFLCHAVNLSNITQQLKVRIFDDTGTDITQAPGPFFIDCDAGSIPQGTACAVRGGSTLAEKPTAAYCVITALSVSLPQIRGAMHALGEGGIVATVEAR